MSDLPLRNLGGSAGPGAPGHEISWSITLKLLGKTCPWLCIESSNKDALSFVITKSRKTPAFMTVLSKKGQGNVFGGFQGNQLPWLKGKGVG